jgi:hypothetical protein
LVPQPPHNIDPKTRPTRARDVGYVIIKHSYTYTLDEDAHGASWCCSYSIDHMVITNNNTATYSSYTYTSVINGTYVFY